ncbi:MAG: carbohydrate kinase family protein [Verrucomicrobiales bacterium]|nr:carbohydrate kinase [Verrucomicrobiota bacterium JB025]
MHSSKSFKIAGIGELLWDVFPTQKRLGGAPANFAYHCNRLGAEAYPVSCVGDDPLGTEIRRQLRDTKVSDRYVFECATHPTGTVDVVLESGKPTYQIHQDVAWDHIPYTPPLEALASTLDAACFGSLSQRSCTSRATIHSILRHMPESSLRIFDVNLRQNFFSKTIIEESLELATALKLSDEELPVLAGFFNLSGDTAAQLDQLLRKFQLDLIAYTRGPDGSMLHGTRGSDDFPGCDGLAVDSVGAGDSFTAALCMATLRGWPLPAVNRFANEVATFVCSQKGATPVLPEHFLNYDAKINQ